MKKFFSLIVFLMLVFMCAAAPQQAAAAFPERPVGFVVIDKTGGAVNGDVYSSWRQVVKWAYHFPYYKIVDDSLPQTVTGDVLRDNVKVTKDVLAALAEKSQVDVLVVAKVYDMNDYIITSGWGWGDDHDTYVRVEADADLYVYKKDGDKFLQKKLRENAIKDLGNYEKPQETINWALSKLVNTMEGRPIIGE